MATRKPKREPKSGDSENLINEGRGRGGRTRIPKRSEATGGSPSIPIPDPVEPPELNPLHLGNEPRIFFDLETTGFGSDSHIIQLAAVGPEGEFNVYVEPKKSISRNASEVTGIRLEGGVMKHHGKEVKMQSLRGAFKDFFAFLGPSKALLAGHNAKTFDSRVLLTAAANVNMVDELKRRTLGFLDTLRLFRELYPRRRSHKLGDLYKTVVGGTFTAHDALEDSKALQRVVETRAPSTDTMAKHTFDVGFVEASLNHLAMKKENLETLYELERVNVSDSMIAKIAASGLRLEHLRAAYLRDPENGILDLFARPLSNGKARVTKTRRIIEAVQGYFLNAEV